MWSRSLILRRLVSTSAKRRSTSNAFSRNRSAIKIVTILDLKNVSTRCYARNLEPKDQKVFELVSKQEAVYMERQAELAWTNKEWDRATQLWREACDSWERVMPKLSALHRLASMYCSRGLYEQCETVYKEALHLIDSLDSTPARLEPGVTFSDEWQHVDYDPKLVGELRTVLLHELGRLYIILGRAAEAHEVLLDAARDWQGWTLLDPSKRGLTSAMSADIALFYEHRSNYREAKQWHLQTLQRNNGRDPLPWDHPQQSSTLHAAMDRYNKPTRAERHGVFDTLEEVQHSIHEHIAHRGDEHVTLVPLHLFEAVLARQLDLHARALQALNRALEISSKRRGEKHASYATVLHHLGLHYHALHQVDEAMQHSLTALKIKQAVLGHDHFHVALIQWDLGMYKLSARQFSDSHVLLESAYHVLSKQYPSRDHPVLQRMHQTVAEVQRVLPRSGATVNSALLNVVKDKLAHTDTDELEQVLFNRNSTADTATARSSQVEAVQQLLSKYLGDKI